MGGAIDSGVSICTHSSPHQTAIEKVQAELRLEHNVREERRRELEFLEKGGNPLDHRFGISASISVQSTSVTDQQLHCQFVTSEAKGSFALATSPRGDSIESSGRLEAAVACEPHSADNFDGQNEMIEDERKFTLPRSNITPSEHSSQLDGGQNFRESGDSPNFQPKKAYRRRKRSNINRGTSRSSSTNITSYGNSSLPSRQGVVPKAVIQVSPSPSEMDVSVTKSAINCFFSEGQFDVSTSKHFHGGMHYQSIKDDGAPADLTSGQPDSFMGREQTISAVGECPPCPASAKPKDDAHPKQLSEPNELEGDKKCLQAEDYVSNIAVISKGLDSESSCTETSVSIEDKEHGSSDAFIPKAESCCSEKPLRPHDPSVCGLKKFDINRSVLAEELQLSVGNQTKVIDKACEDQVLEEARTIEAKRKRIKELSVGPPAKEYRRKSHWDFVLEEMTWMANDFAQEHLWKRKVGAKLCHEAAFASQLKAKELNKDMKIKVVAQTLAKAVMEFWKSVELPSQKTGIVSGLEACGKAPSESMDDNHKMDGVSRSSNKEESHSKNVKVSVQTYALGFMQQNSSVLSIMSSEAFGTTERSYLIDMPEMTALDKYTEEDLFYVVQHGAMQAYRKAIEVYMMQCERAGKTMQEEIDTSINYGLAEFVSEEKKYEEDGDLYYLPGAFEGCQLSKSLQKKPKNPKSYSPILHDLGDHFSIRASTPIKRVHTAPRQTTAGPFNTGGGAFCGDTNPYHDVESTLHGGYLIPKGLEVDSGMDFDKLSTFDIAEIALQPKKKKTKHQGASYDQSRQVDFNMKSGQRNQFKKRMGTHQFEFNCSGGPFGSHAKKAKTVKQSLDNSFGTTALMTSSIASLVGSQMSNMSNKSKLIKLVPSGETGSGSSMWSLFEDEALAVLVHDMGPNWGLVSDAINTTLHFKSIFRTPKECKERHRILMEQAYGYGAGSAENSGSSRPYPSTLPGIPKGGARQLFLQLRGPIEQDIIKSHLVKIILLGQQQMCPRNNQEPKQLVSVHGSHNAALLQVFPNNVNGCVLMPLDLCDMAEPNPDVFSPNSQDPYSSDWLSANQSTSQSALPSSGTNSFLQVLPSVGLDSNLASPSAQLNNFTRDGRYGVPRTCLSIDEQQRLQQHNHINQINMQTPDPFIENDQGLHALPRGNGMVMPGINRSMAMPIPGLQGISSSSMLNSVSMAASNMLTVPNRMKMQSRAIHGQGNSPPIQNSEQQRHVVPSSYPVHHQQQPQLLRQHSTILSNSDHHPHLQRSAYPTSAEQKAFAIRLARERHLQQHLLQMQNSSLMQLQASSPSLPLPPVTSSPPAGTGELIDQEGKQRQTHAQQLHQRVRQSCQVPSFTVP